MWKVYTDGGCKPNPGKGAYCAALYKGDTLIESAGGYLQDTTNNKAEYRACLAGLQLVEAHCDHDDEIIMLLDSQLVIKHLTGEWSVKDETLKSTYLKCFDKVVQYDNMRFEWVKGHSGNTGNDYVDSVCTYFIQRDTTVVTPVKIENTQAKVYLNCPYADKDTAKSLGAKWDARAKKWWVSDSDEHRNTFAKWIT